jgi:hypothetical protein
MKNKNWIIIIVMILCAAMYAISLQVTGNPQASVDFVKWAGGGMITLIIIGWFFGVLG